MKKKKIKVLVYKLILEILERDAKHFNITREKLCNEVIIKLGYRSFNNGNDIKYETKDFLQFNLNTVSKKFYDDIVKQNHSTNESEILRNILMNYVNFNPYIREQIIQDEKVIYFEHIIKEQKPIRVSIGDEIEVLKVLSLERCPVTNYILVVFENKKEYLSKVRTSK